MTWPMGLRSPLNPPSMLARVVLDDVLEGRKEIAKKFGGVPEVGMTVYLAPSESVFRELTQGRIPHEAEGTFLHDWTQILF